MADSGSLVQLHSQLPRTFLFNYYFSKARPLRNAARVQARGPSPDTADDEADTGYASARSPAALPHLLGFADLLSQLLFLAVEVTPGDTFLVHFVLSLSTNRYGLSTRNRRLHITNHLLLLLHQLAMADLPFINIQNRLRIMNGYEWHLTQVFCVTLPINMNHIHVSPGPVCSNPNPGALCGRGRQRAALATCPKSSSKCCTGTHWQQQKQKSRSNPRMKGEVALPEDRRFP